ncbi:hypothetical protein POM88_018705 [Heracleum sosnowskyi]|uniref:Inosine/uridine-preferring nucleoside hydrolase domain-containing protein n=1 Tax=Heracleum sosnowskyi TaxID=360622 RepID=A0AAD8MZJ8_9APIA|nr:hypothetical protein POM88_018705 [Heracleum sosnowskyi]
MWLLDSHLYKFTKNAIAFALTIFIFTNFISVIRPAGANSSDSVAPPANGKLHRILVDTDVDTDDICALLYLLKLNRSEFHLKAITISSNTWSNAGHAVNHAYDMLYMMDRDDINMLVARPIIDQVKTTAGDCRYRQSIPVGSKGILDVDSNFGLRKSFLPQGNRKYTPLRQATALQKNVEHVFIMGGGTHGNLFTAHSANPYAEFNFYQDPFAAYQVIHSGIPVTLGCNRYHSCMMGKMSLHMNITVVTSDTPYGISDGSNPLFRHREDIYNYMQNGIHSGHVQTGNQDPFCLVKGGTGRCEAILVTSTGWANAATVDVVYDMLHMMGRDNIPVGLGEFFAFNQSVSPNSNVGNCKYSKAIPHGSGGLLDSDTLYGFARDLPRSLRRYTAQNAVNNGTPTDTDKLETRQPFAMEIWESIVKSLDPGSKITILNNGPLTNLAKIISSNKSISSCIEDVFIVGGSINYDKDERGNVINIPSNNYAEMNMFLDPLAAKTVFESELNVTLIPLDVQRTVALQTLQLKNHRYQHMETFLGEVLVAVILAGDNSTLKSEFHVKSIKVLATGDVSNDGQIYIDKKEGKPVKVLTNLESSGYYGLFANRLGDNKQSAIVGSFEEQRSIWSRSTN